jgi:hypothetical protein
VQAAHGRPPPPPKVPAPQPTQALGSEAASSNDAVPGAQVESWQTVWPPTPYFPAGQEAQDELAPPPAQALEPMLEEPWPGGQVQLLHCRLPPGPHKPASQLEQAQSPARSEDWPCGQLQLAHAPGGGGSAAQVPATRQ